LDVEISSINFIKTVLILSLTRILWWRKNIIILLLNLELIIISTLYLIILVNIISPFINILIILTLIARASSIGLRLIISLSRSFNSSNSIYIWSLIFDKNFISFIFNFN